MDRRVALGDAKLEFVSLIDQVEKGETVTLTRDGRPVAQLVPFFETVAPDLHNVIEELKNFSKGRILGHDLTIREMIDFGRK